MTDNPSSPFQAAGQDPYNQRVNVSATQPPAAPTPAPASGAVMDVSTDQFMAEVIEASTRQPVLVDFWAPWCGPCKQLAPILEKVVAATRGGVRLVKMDIDKYPEIAGQLRIQSIPAVVAFVDGKPADAFMGAKSETEVRAFVDKIIAMAPAAADDDVTAALEEATRRRDEGNHAGAAEVYAAILAHDPDSTEALSGLAQAYLDLGDRDRARALIDQADPTLLEKAPLAAIKAAIDLGDEAEGLGELDELEGSVAANPDDHQARYDYAIALNASGKRDEAAEQLLTIVKRDREWNEDGARTKLLEFFESWGATDPATSKARRGLSSALFS